VKISLNWLKQYFSTEINHEVLVKSFNLMSQEVSGLHKFMEIDNLVVGHVTELRKHPDADKLSVCTVDIKEEKLQIICGAPNVDVNQKVIVAKVGAVLPGNFKIKKAKIRGIESFGMICSLAELGIQEFDAEEKGIYVLNSEAEIGADPIEFMNLDDYVLELDLTANRSDLLSMRGVAYDVACMLNLSLDFHEPMVIRETTENPVNIYTQTKDSTVYYGQIIENIKVKDSPYWMKARLMASGIRPINNVVDITNYVMLEYGQPLHAFDYDKINSDRIIVREAQEDEVLITLDGSKRELKQGDIVITDGERPIALAGVMGGLDTEIDVNSNRVLLESAVFNPVKVRKTANRLNLKSESSSRFEKGIDASKTLEALNYACELLKKYADAIIVGFPSYYNTEKPKNNVIKLSLDKLNSVTGYDFNEDVVKDILDRLRFKYKYRNKTFSVTPPSRRPMGSYQDIIEEIVRINGYDKIPISIPITPTQGGLNRSQFLRREVRRYLVDRGLTETKTYSLVSEELSTKYDTEYIKPISILNALTKEREYLRHSLLPSMLNVAVYNSARKINDIFLFEIGNTYYQDKEVRRLAIVTTGKIDVSAWQKQNQSVDFYHLKGIIESLLEKLKVENYSFEVSKDAIPNLHPGISANLLIDKQIIGFMGKLHPEEEMRIGLKDVYVCELELDKVISSVLNNEVLYQEISKYPSVKRDIAIVIDKEINASEVIKVIKNDNQKLLKDVEIFDLYTDEKMGNSKSLALTLEFSSDNRTLETKEVDKQIDKILESLKVKLNAELRS